MTEILLAKVHSKKITVENNNLKNVMKGKYNQESSITQLEQKSTLSQSIDCSDEIAHTLGTHIENKL